jgi:GDP-L-fucose synthase
VKRSSRIYVAGGETLLGRAILQRLRAEGFTHLLGAGSQSPQRKRGREKALAYTAGSEEPDLTVRAQVEDFFGEYRPEYVFLAAGRSGGIALNRERPADLMLDNLLVTAHVLDAAHTDGVRKLLYLASSCSYPKHAPQPMRVESLLSGPPEPTNAAYATAKLAGWQLACAYRQQHGASFLTAIPANAFGPGDDFGADTGHVIPALLRRMHEAKRNGEPTFPVWGTGTARREFIAASDVADACVHLMRHHDGDAPVNVGNATSYTIAEVAHLIAEVVGYKGEIVFDRTKPDGMPLKILDSAPLFATGWRPRADFRAALAETYRWFLQHEVTEDRPDEREAVPLAVPDSPRRGGDRPRLPRR